MLLNTQMPTYHSGNTKVSEEANLKVKLMQKSMMIKQILTMHIQGDVEIGDATNGGGTATVQKKMIQNHMLKYTVN